MSGMWLSSVTLGGFIGPLGGGFLYERIGFQNTSVVFIVMQVIICLWLCVYIYTSRGYSAPDDELGNTRDISYPGSKTSHTSTSSGQQREDSKGVDNCGTSIT